MRQIDTKGILRQVRHPAEIKKQEARGMRFRRRLLTGAWLASGLVLLSAVTARAADSYTNFAKTYIASVTAPGSPWTGPTTGPVAQANKSVIFVDYDERNSGGRGVGQAAAEAAKIIGWQYRVLDGQGTIQGQTAALTQAIALKPDGIILGSVDALGMNSLIQQAIDHGISVVSWHSGMTPGKIKGSNIFTNVTTDPVQVGKVAGLYAVADSGGKANVILFTDSAYAITIAKTDAEEAAIKPCGGCKVLAVEDTPLGDVHDRMPELTTALLTKYGVRWTYSIAINDLYYDFMAPTLQAAGLAGDGTPHNISAGDGSESAFQRIANKQYQVATVAEPLRAQAFQLIDELNRAFAGQPPSGYSSPVHLFTAANVNEDRGPGGIYDPHNGYEAAYRKIWQK
jgi:ribose transport system substrate-binding protein